ncbi:hypothetical protein QBC42DRAFT_299914 [Cladorrhinum samala]|uniref:Uncharacterized protein n=1 Tax=Cladorrhinum samala TaxID=585594 RepID=A0AAV9HFL0_9PEZI|nr:hypothetical protein QBC42DRAFT_299914 [Cladorrhinum samala]
MTTPNNRQNQQHQGKETPDYKPQLDSRAEESFSPKPPSPNEEPSLVEKVSKKVPIIGTLLGSTSESEQQQQQAQKQEPQISPNEPPVRPHHDTQIEEFIKDQHRSKPVAGEVDK